MRALQTIISLQKALKLPVERLPHLKFHSAIFIVILDLKLKLKATVKQEALTVDSKFFKDNLSSIEEQKKRLLEYKPESFYNRSLKEEPNKIKSSPFKNPEAITIILSTGLFSELTSVVPFYKVLSKDYESSFRRKLDKALSKRSYQQKYFL